MAAVCKPLIRLLKKGTAFEWGEEQEAAFAAIKQWLTSPPVLAYPDEGQVQILTTDASYQGSGTILSQSPDGSSQGETVIAHASRSLKSTEENYAPTHLEALGIVWAVNHFRHYLASRHFKLFTDHAGLQYILTIQNQVRSWSDGPLH